MKAIPNRGISVTRADGKPCRSGAHGYWDSHLSEIVRQYLGAFCPTVQVVKSPEAGDGDFAVVFHRDDRGRELCGKSDSLENPKAVVSPGDVVALVDALDAMHRKANDPAIGPDNREFIRKFRIPNPLAMGSSWRVLRGEGGLALLWGYADPGRGDATLLPLTETSRNWPDASQRVDVREMLAGAGRIGQKKSKVGRLALSALAVLCGVALLFACRPSLPNLPRNVGRDRGSAGGRVEPTEGKAAPEERWRQPPGEEWVGGRGGAEPARPVRPPDTKCDVHPEQSLVRGECPVKCGICGSHLEGEDGTRCPMTCRVHPGVHKVNGVCPECETPIVIEKAWIEQLGERQDGTTCYPVFGFKSFEPIPAEARVEWSVDGREVAGEGMQYGPQNGFGAGESHRIAATASFSRSGRMQRLTTPAFTWTKSPVAPEAVERHIGLCGKKSGENGYECFVLKLFSHPEDKKAVVRQWSAESCGKPIPTVDGGHNTMCLYKNGIPGDGKIVVTADTLIDGKTSRRITASFEFKADILSADRSFESSSVDRASAIRELAGPSVVICHAGELKGTAFAVTGRDLVTNHHVVREASDGKVVLMKQGWKAPVPAKVIASDPEADLAWLQVNDELFNPLPLASERRLPAGTEVASFGYPYSSGKDLERVSNMTTTLGVIKGEQNGLVWHTAEIYAGNSGGPLIDMRGFVVGVNKGCVGKCVDNEMRTKRDLAIPAERIGTSFPRLASRLKK